MLTKRRKIVAILICLCLIAVFTTLKIQSDKKEAQIAERIEREIKERQEQIPEMTEDMVEDATEIKVNGEIYPVDTDIREILRKDQQPPEITERTGKGVDLVDLLMMWEADSLSDEDLKVAIEEGEGDFGLITLEKEAERLIRGSLEWSSKRKDKEDYTSFRCGEYNINDLILNSEHMYETILSDIRKYNIKTQVKIENIDVFFHPVRSGHTVGADVKFKYTSKNGVEIYGYEPGKWEDIRVEFMFGYLTENHNGGNIWDGGDTGLSLIGQYLVK